MMTGGKPQLPVQPPSPVSENDGTETSSDVRVEEAQVVYGLQGANPEVADPAEQILGDPMQSRSDWPRSEESAADSLPHLVPRLLRERHFNGAI